MLPTTDEFAPHWPEGLKRGGRYKLPCSEKAPDQETADLSVIIIDNGDICVEAFQRNLNTGMTDRTEVWCRHGIGGGVYPRTHQALLMLAQAIRLDSQDLEEQNNEATD